MDKLPTIDEYINAYYPEQGKEPYSREQVRRILKGYSDLCILHQTLKLTDMLNEAAKKINR